MLTACSFGGGGEETLEPNEEQTGTPSNAASEATDTEASAGETPSPTQVATGGDLFLQLVEPAELEVITDVGSMTGAGRTRGEAWVTISDNRVEPNIDGEFSLEMALEDGPNIIELLASVASGEQMDLVLVAIYAP